MTTKTQKRLECTPQSWCTRLEERLAPEANQHVKGLVQLVVTTNHSKPRNIRLGVFYRTSPTDRGLMLSFCPWCGTNLLELKHLAGTGERMPEVTPEHAP